MSADMMMVFWVFCVFVIMLFIIGFYCILATYNLIRALIGIELLIKAVTLLIILVGYANGHTALTQSFVITLIVIEVAMITVAAGIVLGLQRHNNSLDIRKIRNLKG